MWAMARPDPSELPTQGWKLHVSATVHSAASALAACFPVLEAERCAFKIARGTSQVWMLTGPWAERSELGKVITVYPPDDDAAVRIAAALDVATRGLDGPRVLSDRPFAADSLVHYRFGAYGGRTEVTLDGKVAAVLCDPAGRSCTDRREPQFTAPDWVTDPFRDDVRRGGVGQPGPVLLHNRYQVQAAIRHAARGGVFRAIDVTTRRSVVIKQARRHVLSDAPDRDARSRLRRESEVLSRLANLDDVPDLVELFEADGDLFLVEQDFGGQTLRAWTEQGLRRRYPARPLAGSLSILVDIVALVRRLHQHGVVVCDLSPNNLLVDEAGQVRLVDLELAWMVGEELPGRGMGTPGYFAPEQSHGQPVPASDLYAVGKLVLYVLTGEDAAHEDRPGTIQGWLDIGSRRRFAPERYWTLAEGLCAAYPAGRPAISEVLRTLSARPPHHRAPTAEEVVDHALQPGRQATDDDLDDEIETLLSHLLSDIDLGGAWPVASSIFGRTTVATNVQHGSAGVLGVLTQAARCLLDPRLEEPAATLASWTRQRLDQQPRQGPVGLYFGAAGGWWALADAAELNGDRTLLASAVEGALRLPRVWPLHDITHGLAGVGLTLMRLWHSTHDQRLLTGAQECADTLLGTVRRDRFGPFWQPEPAIASQFAGTRFTTYAHGLAGVVSFLQHVHAVEPSARTGDLVDESVTALLDLAVTEAGCIRWRSAPDSPSPASSSWCNGATGVLIPLVNTAAHPREVLPTIAGAAASVVVDARHWGIAYCHGLAGSIDALVDVADVLPGEPWTDRARMLAAEAIGRQVSRPPRAYADPRGREDVADFGIGYSGLLSSLLRLRYGGARLWTCPAPTPASMPVPTGPRPREEVMS